MSEYVDFHYMPLEGKITGEQVLKQTEDAINDLGNKVYNLDIDQSEIDEAIEKSNEAVNTANSALSAVTTGRSVWFNNVAEMVATDIEAGVTAETKGYYVANDGGNALYLIRQEKSGDVVDGGSLIALDNGNMAELVTDGTVNVKQFGAIGNGTDDDTTAFQNTSSYAQSNGFVPFVGVATYKITNSVTGAFNSFGEVTITGGGTVDIINLQEVVSDVSDIRDEVVDETASAKAYSESAATYATNASNSASSASTTATQLMEYLATKETLTAPAVDPTLTISGAAADAMTVGKKFAAADGNLLNIAENIQFPISFYANDISTTAYTTTIINNVMLVTGRIYTVSALLNEALSQDGYLTLRKSGSNVASVTINAGDTTGSFNYYAATTDNDYDVVFSTGSYAKPAVISVSVIPTTKGSVTDVISDKQKMVSKIAHDISNKIYYSANMYDGNYVENRYITLDGLIGSDANYGYTQNFIRVNPGDNITTNDGSAIRSMRFVTAYDYNYDLLPAKGVESALSYVVPSDVYYIKISALKSYFSGGTLAVQNSTVMLPYDTYSAEDVARGCPTYHDTHYILSSNIFDGEYVSGQGIKNDGSGFIDANYSYTKNYIPVDAGDDIVLTNNNGLRYMRYICAYDADFNVLANKGLSDGTYSYWTVPEDVKYIKITGNTSVITSDSCAIYRSKGLVFYTPDDYNIVQTDNRALLRMKHEPLRLMPNYITETLSYRQVGNLSKGYICITSDDGTTGLATYTIPLAISKGIPMAFAVMRESQVFQDASMTATVLDAVNNHGCSLMQHGGILWDLLSEIDLNNFFDAEKEYFDTLNVELRGAAIPQHRTNSLVKAVAGARFGVVRSGYTGLGPGDVDNGSITNYYNYYTSGERSNIYGLSSYNCSYQTIAYNRAAVDYAKANNKIMIVYYHEFDLDNDKKAVIEDLIDYAKAQGLTFITPGDIPTLETWDGN